MSNYHILVCDSFMYHCDTELFLFSRVAAKHVRRLPRQCWCFPPSIHVIQCQRKFKNEAEMHDIHFWKKGAREVMSRNNEKLFFFFFQTHCRSQSVFKTKSLKIALITIPDCHRPSVPTPTTFKSTAVSQTLHRKKTYRGSVFVSAPGLPHLLTQ